MESLVDKGLVLALFEEGAHALLLVGALEAGAEGLLLDHDGAVNVDLKTVVDDHFADAKWCHVCQPVWNYLHQRSYAGMRRKLYAYFYDRQLSLFSFAENRFRFVNTFDGTNSHDSVFYILSVWQQLALDQRRDEMHLVGDIPEREEMTGQLRRFLQNVYRINPSGDFNRAPVTQIEGLPYDLMTLHLKGRG